MNRHAGTGDNLALVRRYRECGNCGQPFVMREGYMFFSGREGMQMSPPVGSSGAARQMEFCWFIEW